MHAIRDTGTVHLVTGHVTFHDLDIGMLSRSMIDGPPMARVVTEFFRRRRPGFERAFAVGPPTTWVHCRMLSLDRPGDSSRHRAGLTAALLPYTGHSAWTRIPRLSDVPGRIPPYTVSMMAGSGGTVRVPATWGSE